MIVEREREARAERQSQPSGERVVRGESSQRARAREHTRHGKQKHPQCCPLCERRECAQVFSQIYDIRPDRLSS